MFSEERIPLEVGSATEMESELIVLRRPVVRTPAR